MRLSLDLDNLTRSELWTLAAASFSVCNVFAEASSAFHFEENLAILTYRDFHFLTRDGDYEFKIVQIGKDKIVAMIDLSIIAEAECDFSFAVWDSIDREYVPMGSTNVQTKVEFDATALITFEGDFSATPPEVEMSNLELLDTIGSVDFGDIDMDDDWYED